VTGPSPSRDSGSARRGSSTTPDDDAAGRSAASDAATVDDDSLDPSEDARRARVQAVLDKHQATGEPVTAVEVAEEAGVPRWWLYKYPDVIDAVNHARQHPRPRPHGRGRHRGRGPEDRENPGQARTGKATPAAAAAGTEPGHDDRWGPLAAAVAAAGTPPAPREPTVPAPREPMPTPGRVPGPNPGPPPGHGPTRRVGAGPHDATQPLPVTPEPDEPADHGDTARGRHPGERPGRAGPTRPRDRGPDLPGQSDQPWSWGNDRPWDQEVGERSQSWEPGDGEGSTAFSNNDGGAGTEQDAETDGRGWETPPVDDGSWSRGRRARRGGGGRRGRRHQPTRRGGRDPDTASYEQHLPDGHPRDGHPRDEQPRDEQPRDEYPPDDMARYGQVQAFHQADDQAADDQADGDEADDEAGPDRALGRVVERGLRAVAGGVSPRVSGDELEAAVSAGALARVRAATDPRAPVAQGAAQTGEHAAAASAARSAQIARAAPAALERGQSPRWLARAGQLVPVLGATSGVGASVFAAALFDVLAAAGVEVMLIDTADPVRSGLAAASDQGPVINEIDDVAIRASRRTSHRGYVLRLSVPASGVFTAGMVPPPHCWLPDNRAPDVTIVDLGWDSWALAAYPLRGPGAWMEITPQTPLGQRPRPVLVCAPTRPSVARADQVLTRLRSWTSAQRISEPAALVVSGAARWPRGVRGVGSRELARLEPVTFLPRDSGIAVGGIGPDPLPAKLQRAAAGLAERWRLW